LHLLGHLKKLFILIILNILPIQITLKILTKFYIQISPTTTLDIVGSEKIVYKLKFIKIDAVDCRDLNIPERNLFIYVCGYLIKKRLEKHICQVCIDYARFQNQLDQSFLLYFLKLTLKMTNQLLVI